MKTLFSYLFVLVLMTHAFGQSKNNSDSFVLVKKIAGKYTYMNVDVFDNIYVVDASKRIIKLNGNGDSIAAYNDIKRFGGPTYLDVSNPLKPLVFCSNFSTVVFLDKLLVYRSHVNLQKQNIFNCKLVATSYDNNFWLFDMQDFKLKKSDDKGNVLLESADLRMMQTEAPTPTMIAECNGNVILYDQEKGFYLFDYYGGYQNNLAFQNWLFPGADKDVLFGFSDNILHTYRLKTLDLREYHLPFDMSLYKSVKVMNGKLYLLNNKGIEIYIIR